MLALLFEGLGQLVRAFEHHVGSARHLERVLARSACHVNEALNVLVQGLQQAAGVVAQ
jgi:hypothetical protein